MSKLSPEHEKTPVDGRGSYQNNLSNYAENSTTLRDAIVAAGMSPPEHIDVGITRFPGGGKKQSNRSGWCWLSDDRQGAAFGDYSTGFRTTWTAEADALKPVDWQAIEREQQRRRDEQHRRHEAAALESQTTYAAGRQPTGKHGYLARKQIERFASIFRLDQRGRLIAPLEDITGYNWNNQYIDANGEKRFHPGARVTGCFCVLHRPDNHTHIIICEGIATGCTLATVEPTAIVISAMNAGNLLPVARDIRRTYPHHRIIIAGDNDRLTDGNPGKTAAIEAARAIAGEYSIPEFPPGVPGTDFNDLYCAGCLS